MNTGEKVLAALEGYGLKPEGTGNWRCNSPLRPGSNSFSFTLTIETDGEHGLWCDHAGGEGGTLYELADHLGIERPSNDRTEVSNSKIAYRNLAEYAALKGVPEQVFIDAQWSREPVQANDPIDHKKMRPALSFPTQGGTRYRFVDGLKPAFKSQKGYKACWYGLARAAALAQKHNLPLVLCNGEPSTIVGLYFQVPACCITGGEKATIPANLLEELKRMWSGEILVAMDCDQAGRKSTLGKVANLRAAGFNVRGVDLWLGDKGDLADFCKLNTEMSMQNLLALEPMSESEQPQQKTLPPADVPKIPVVKRSERLSGYIERLTDFETPRLLVPFPFPLKALHQYGGMARVVKPGKMIGIVGVSGGGKTSLLETLVDLLLLTGVACLAWSPEWTPDEFVERAVQRYGGPRTDELYLHEIFVDEKQRGITKGYGRELSPDQYTSAAQAVAKLRTFETQLGYLDMPMMTLSYLETAIDNTLQSIDFKPRVLVIDYVQLLSALEPGNTSMYDLLIRIKMLCNSRGLTPIVSSQVTKGSTKSQQNGRVLEAIDARFVNDDAFNLFITVNPDRDSVNNYLPSAVLNVAKNSKGTKGKIRLPVDWERGLFTDRPHSNQNFDESADLLVF